MLKDKSIFILSPEPWGEQYISKHNYAIELSKDNDVYFFSPPNGLLKERFYKRAHPDIDNLFIIEHKFNFYYNLRFHFRYLYERLIAKHIKEMLNYLKIKPDIVWSFDLNLYRDLSLFNGDITIFHPVDVIDMDQSRSAENSDVVFSVSQKILDSIKCSTPKFVINHGLSEIYENQAQENLKNLDNFLKSRINVGYVGNLLNFTLDVDVFKETIDDNPDIIFNFWGSYETKDNNLGGELNTKFIDFINWLKNKENVRLHGRASQAELKDLLGAMDMFILIYKYPNGDTDRLNAHKILEYFTFGKVVVSTQISFYKDMPELIPMSFENNGDFVPLFSKISKELEFYNSKEMQEKRINYAIANTYGAHLKRIEQILVNL